MLIDVHAHVHPPDYLKALFNSGRYEIERGLGDQIIVKHNGARFLTVTDQAHDPVAHVARMDRAGIDVQVLSITTPNVYFLEGQDAIDLARGCNDYIAGMIASYPGRFQGLASIPLTADIDSAIAELVRCMDDYEMPGFIIGTNIDGIPIDDVRFDPLYEEANRRGAVMFVHPMVPIGMGAMQQYALGPLVGFAFDTTLAASRLIFSNFFGRFLNVNVVVSHLGGALPYLAGRLDVGYETYPECQVIARPPAEIIDRLYLDSVSFHEPALRCAAETVGEDHIMFGTDFSEATGDVATAVDSVNRVFGRRHRNKVFGDTARQLYRIGA
jgi:aminocarboxymuconate-semialdehyde decarboxylase